MMHNLIPPVLLCDCLIRSVLRLLPPIFPSLQRNSSTQRFKVTSKLRCLQSSVTDGSSQEGDSSEMCAGGDGIGGVLTENRVHICDAMQEMEEEQEEQSVGLAHCM